MTLADFIALFGLSAAAALLAAPVLALVGCLLHLRREAFLGVAVPQFATAGVALALALLPRFPALERSFLDHGHPPLAYLLGFAAAAAIAALAWYGAGSAGRGAGGASLAGGFALAGAAAAALLAGAPAGENYAKVLMLGDVLYLDLHDFEVLATVAILGMAFLMVFRRSLIVDAVDPEQAFALGLPARQLRRALPVVLGAMIGCGVMTLGPLLVFVLLFLPPLAAAELARGLRSFLLLGALIALLCAVAAWPLAVTQDIPYGPTAGLACGVVWFASRLLRRLRPAP